MFTGIVSGLGIVAETSEGRIGIEHEPIAARSAIGGSVAVNGACLTVVEVEGAVFYADVVPETLKRTNLGLLEIGDQVNLELPLTPDQLLDGHLVQGHVDATAQVREVRTVDRGREVSIELPGSWPATWPRRGRSPSTASASRSSGSTTKAAASPSR